jgi:hypothetical protein
VIIITGPRFNANLALMHAIKDRAPGMVARIVAWGSEPSVIHPNDRWFVLAPSEMPEDAPWPAQPYTVIDVDVPLGAQVDLVLQELR